MSTTTSKVLGSMSPTNPAPNTQSKEPNKQSSSYASILEAAAKADRKTIAQQGALAILAFAPVVYTYKPLRRFRPYFIPAVLGAIEIQLQTNYGHGIFYYAGYPARKIAGKTIEEGIVEKAKREKERVEGIVERVVAFEERGELEIIGREEERRRRAVEWELQEGERRLNERRKGLFGWAFFWDRGQEGGAMKDDSSGLDAIALARRREG